MPAIEIPDDWAIRFQRFDDALAVIQDAMRLRGISPMEMGATFRTFGRTRRSVWLDPSFRVWAALRGCVTFADFYGTVETREDGIDG